jgi:hypothetical protein
MILRIDDVISSKSVSMSEMDHGFDMWASIFIK